MTVLIQKEIKLANEEEMLKQDLATNYDCNYDDLYHEIDDCNFGFIDSSALKRFLLKCSIYASDLLLIAIIRRQDLDADARLNKEELIQGILPLEKFTRGSLSQFKKNIKRTKSAIGRTQKITIFKKENMKKKPSHVF